jgi:hypothetical protein
MPTHEGRYAKDNPRITRNPKIDDSGNSTEKPRELDWDKLDKPGALPRDGAYK